jgi:DNA-3-methyladenine glycosylase
MDVRTKRIYEEASPQDGARVLVDRLWPRGVSKEAAKLDVWLRDAAPSHGLRARFHGERKDGDWEEFCRLYAGELDGHPQVVAELLALAGRGPLTLLYASRDEAQNNAAALKSYLEKAGVGR